MALTVVVLGDNCVDRYLPPIDQEFIGGQAVNVASHLARLGLEVAYAGVVGDDDAGAWILTELRARGVDVGAVERARGSTGVTLIATTPEGERRFVAEDYGVSAPYRPTRRALELARGADLVYGVHVIDPLAVAEALQASALLAIDVSEESTDRLPLSPRTILFVSRPWLTPEAAVADAQRLVGAGAGVVVVTLGRLGAAACAGAEVAVCPADSRAVVDTLGAGDALAATFLARRLTGASLGDALHAASAAAAAACTHIGAFR